VQRAVPAIGVRSPLPISSPSWPAFKSIFWWAVAVFVIVESLLLITLARYRARRGAAEPKPGMVTRARDRVDHSRRADPRLIAVHDAPQFSRRRGTPRKGALRVEVIGTQWWWDTGTDVEHQRVQ